MTEDDIRQAIIARGTKRWNRVNSPSLIGRLFSPLFGGKLDAIVIVEHDASDQNSMVCEGNIIGAWQQDENGLNSIDPAEVDPGPLRGKRWSKHVLRFHISDDHSQVIANEMEGPEQGSLMLFKVKPHESGVKLALRRTSLVLGGTAMG